VGTFAALGALDVGLVMVLLALAAVLGDAVNYAIGRRLGPRVFTREGSRWLNPRHLERTREFYARYGPITIVLARFVPIVRTFAPFVAGIGRMSYPRFALYNVLGAVLWIGSLTLAGYFFGNIPLVRRNFSLVILVIVLLSILPAVLEMQRARQAHRRAGRAHEVGR
jgi:membrane-associated protein